MLGRLRQGEGAGCCTAVCSLRPTVEPSRRAAVYNFHVFCQKERKIKPCCKEPPLLWLFLMQVLLPGPKPPGELSREEAEVRACASPAQSCWERSKFPGCQQPAAGCRLVVGDGCAAWLCSRALVLLWVLHQEGLREGLRQLLCSPGPPQREPTPTKAMRGRGAQP